MDISYTSLKLCHIHCPFVFVTHCILLIKASLFSEFCYSLHLMLIPKIMLKERKLKGKDV